MIWWCMDENESVENLSDWKIIVVREGSPDQVYYVHRAIMAKGSKMSLYFSNAFRKTGDVTFVENQTRTSTIADLDPPSAAAAMPVMLDYMYSETNDLAITDGNALDIHHLADYFMVDSLKELAEVFVRSMLTVENFKDVHTYARTHNSDGLKELVEVFVQTMLTPQHFMDVYAYAKTCNSDDLIDVVAAFIAENSSKLFDSDSLFAAVAAFFVKNSSGLSSKVMNASDDDFFLRVIEKTKLDNPKPVAAAIKYYIKFSEKPISVEEYDAPLTATISMLTKEKEVKGTGYSTTTLTNFQRHCIGFLVANWKSVDMRQVVAALRELNPVVEKHFIHQFQLVAQTCCSQIVVTGAGTNEINGTYKRVVNESPEYVMKGQTNSYIIRLGKSQGSIDLYWWILRTEGPHKTYFYRSMFPVDGLTTVSPQTTWINVGNGHGPVPTLLFGYDTTPWQVKKSVFDRTFGWHEVLLALAFGACISASLFWALSQH